MALHSVNCNRVDSIRVDSDNKSIHVFISSYFVMNKTDINLIDIPIPHEMVGWHPKAKVLDGRNLIVYYVFGFQSSFSYGSTLLKDKWLLEAPRTADH